MKLFLKQFGVYVGALLVTFVIFVGISVVRGANPPPINNPPAGNVPPPINTGIDLQVKLGIIGAEDFWVNATPSAPTVSVRDALLQVRHYHLEISEDGQKCEFREGLGEDKNCVGNMTTVRAPSFLRQIVARLVPRAQAYIGANDPGIQPSPTGGGGSAGFFSPVAGDAMEFCRDQDGCSFLLQRRFMNANPPEQFVRAKGPNRLFVSSDDRWSVGVDQGDTRDSGNTGHDGARGKQDVVLVQGECFFSDAETSGGSNPPDDNGLGFGLYGKPGANVCVLDIWD